MNYLILSLIVIVISYIYEQYKKANKLSNGYRLFFYVIICFCLCLFAGLRTKYNDTYAYIDNFLDTPREFSSLFKGDASISEVYLFKIWNYVIYNFISQNENVYLFLSSLIFVLPSVYLIDKYSKNFSFSMIIYMFGGMYLFSLAGLKQSMATGIILLSLPSLIKKNYLKYYISCLIALGFHTYGLFFLILPLLGIETFNKRTICFCVSIILIGLTLSFFSGVITSIVEFLGKEIDEELITKGSVSLPRAIVFIIPLILTIVSRIRLGSVSITEKWFIKIGILSSSFMILSMFGNPILFGRIPQYFFIGIVISMPLLIEKAFVKNEQSIILIIATICYIIFGIYSLYIDNGLTKDIFGLIWF